MNQINLNKLKKALPVLSPDSHKSFLTLLKSEQKRCSENDLKTTPSIRRDWENWLTSDNFNWQIFGTLTAQGGLTGKQINRHVNKWYEMLVKRLNTIKPLACDSITSENFRVFWVAEANTKSVSYTMDKFHLHILVECSPWIKNNLFTNGCFNEFNFFCTAWQYTQGRKPYVIVSDSDTGIPVKKELKKFRTHFVDLTPHKINDLMSLNLLVNNRAKYCAKYVAKDTIQFGFLTPENVSPSFYHEDSNIWVNCESYIYEYVKSKAQAK